MHYSDTSRPLFIWFVALVVVLSHPACSEFDAELLSIESTDSSDQGDGKIIESDSSYIDASDGSGEWREASTSDGTFSDSAFSGSAFSDSASGDSVIPNPDGPPVCDPGFDDCDDDPENGCETALENTVSHCGACDNDCNSLLPNTQKTSCTSGKCNIITCADGWADCDTLADTGCEWDLKAEGSCIEANDCVEQTYNSNRYFFCSNAATWGAARAYCQMQQDRDLVAVSSAEENQFVRENITDTAWLGARDAAIEGSWLWDSTGVVFWNGAASGATVLGQYESWGDEQPDDGSATENCALVESDGNWNDADCAQTHPFVCEQISDACPDDDDKVDPGQCGCGVADTDTDSDNIADCVDDCANDPNKTDTGQCGCGQPDTDSDGDGAADCVDGCVLDPTHTDECLGFTPSNFDPSGVNWSAQPNSRLNCGTTTIDSTDPDGAGPSVATITNWCGTAPTPFVQIQNGGPEIIVVPLTGLTIDSGNTLRLVGPRPVAFAVDGKVTIDGTIDASASDTTPGAGGNYSCEPSQGGDGTGEVTSWRGASGGGGGGFGTAGGMGGDANTDRISANNVRPGGAAGVTRGSAALIPLLGGCSGGRGGNCSSAGGAGGGAVQISASGLLEVNGTIRANGGNGATPCGPTSEGGGTGGGSGGAILLEAATVDTAGSTIETKGGRGGRNGSFCGVYAAYCGIAAGGAGSSNASTAGSNGQDSKGGGPGGGGGFGRIHIATR